MTSPPSTKDRVRIFLARLPGPVQHAIWRTSVRLRDPRRFRSRVDRRLPTADTPYSYHPYDMHRCIFIHIPKCAGISIAQTLFGALGGGHTTVAEYQIAFGPIEFARYFKFTFVRNPWDRLVSAFLYLKDGGMTPADREFAAEHLAGCDDFDQFVRQWVTPANIWRYMHFRPQYHYLCFETGPPRVDFVGLFENLRNDFAVIADRLGLDRELEHRNAGRRRDRRDYKEFYTDETRRIVAGVYARDIELLGYSFDNSSVPEQLARRSGGRIGRVGGRGWT